MDAGLLLYDHAERLIFFNKSAVELLGPAGAGLRAGQGFGEWLDACRKKGAFTGLAQEWMSALRVQSRTNGCGDYLTCQGRWLSLRWSSCDQGARMLTVTDVTAQKARETGRKVEELFLLREVVESSHEALAVFTYDGRITYVNAAYRRLFGENCGKYFCDPYLPEAQAVILEQIRPALQSGNDWEGVLQAVGAEGRTLAVWQRLGVVRDEKGRPAFYFAMLHDHSGQQQVEDELVKAKEAAEQANIAKTRFLAAASHDLRQPLQALNMFVAVLAERAGPELTPLVGRIQDSVGALESLLNSLLEVSKLEAGLVVPARETFCIGTLLQRLGAEFRAEAEAEDLDLRLVNSNLRVESDPSLVERILRNLLHNALRYTPQGRILIGCRRRGTVLRVEVWDTGIGIPENQTQAIFREFYQLGNPARDRRQGLGLGLAIVERLASLLGHRLHVRSKLGKGSVFAVDLPLAVHDAQLDEQGETHHLSPPPATRREACVVIIDDEPDVLESTRLLLESWGHHVLTGLNTDQALRRVSNSRCMPDLIIADYRLQNGSNGGFAIQRMRTRLQKEIPAIILTGDTAPERLRQAKASGHGLLHKPVQPQALRAAIDQALARYPT